MRKRIVILGAGTWGVALSRTFSRNGHDVTVWSKFLQEIEQLNRTRTHPNLPGMVIPDTVSFTNDLSVCADCDALLFAVPSVFVRETAERVLPFLSDHQLIIDVAKGIEADTLLTMTQIIGSVLQEKHPRLVALSGPTHAEEVALDMPTSIVAAGHQADATLVQDLLMNTCMRTYTNRDVLGVELCGALKNIVALASGISAGLGYGDNSRAALITRGMVEITRLGVAMGCLEQTFYGLAGIGDLIVTATSQHSRNNRCGLLIGQGMTPADAVRQVGMVVEGVNAIPAAVQLSQRYGVEMPIIAGMDAIINRGVAPADIALALMTRQKKPEYGTLKPATKELPHRVAIIGAFDRMDYKALHLLRRAAALGDELLVGLLTEEGCAALQLPVPVQTFDARREALELLRNIVTVLPVGDKITLP